MYATLSMCEASNEQTNHFPIFNYLFSLCTSVLVFFLFNTGNDAPRGTSSTNHVLVGDGQQVTFFHRQLDIQASHPLHEVHHFCTQSIRYK